MKTRRWMAALLAVLLTLSLGGCGKETVGKGSGEASGDNTIALLAPDDFAGKLHQYTKPDQHYSLAETEAGYYFVSYGMLYFIDRDTQKVSLVCAKPDCDHMQDNVCNARLNGTALHGGEEISYVRDIFENTVERKTVRAVEPDGTAQREVQELKANNSIGYERTIYHRGYVYYISEGVLYRVKYGGAKDSAEVLWTPANTGEDQVQGNYTLVGAYSVQYALWAEEDTLYFMVNLPREDGTTRDTLFACDLQDLSVQQVWETPSADEVGAWETTGVSASQWYISDGTIYFYLAGNGLWKTDLSTGKTEKLADTGDQIPYGSAVYSDDTVCIVNDIPKFWETSEKVYPGSPWRYDADALFVYGMDGTFRKEISLQPLFDDLGHVSTIELVLTDGQNAYFVTTAMTYSTQDGFPIGNKGDKTLCRADLETGEVSPLYTLL